MQKNFKELLKVPISDKATQPLVNPTSTSDPKNEFEKLKKENICS